VPEGIHEVDHEACRGVLQQRRQAGCRGDRLPQDAAGVTVLDDGVDGQLPSRAAGGDDRQLALEGHDRFRDGRRRELVAGGGDRGW
jgi:hypothetical protein